MGCGATIASEHYLYITTSIDFALAVLEQTLPLPASAGLTLFALGRTVGWIGHALEQYQGRRLIRPRARYTGVPPPPAL